MSDDTMRDDLNAAIEEFEEKEDGAEAGTGTDADAGGDTDSSGVPDADDSGDGSASDSAPDDVVAAVDNLSDDELPGDSGSTPVSDAPTGLKAPAGWNPQQREQWSKSHRTFKSTSAHGKPRWPLTWPTPPSPVLFMTV